MTAIEQDPVTTSESDSAGAVSWVTVCAADRIRRDRGVAALVAGQPVAIFRLSPVDAEPEEWCAVSHIDPDTGSPVMARGLVGSVGNPPLVIPTVASPIYKQRYNLRTGACLDRADLALQTFPVRLHDGQVEVGAPVMSA